MRRWRCPNFCRLEQPADVVVCQRCGTRLVPVPQTPPEPVAAVACLKRVTVPGGDYGFCRKPDGHDVTEVDKLGIVIRAATPCGDAHCTPPPPPSSFGPKKGS